MSFTSWDRTKRTVPILVEGDGPTQLGIFTDKTAEVAGQTWKLDVNPKLGASATLADDRVFRAAGNLSRDDRIEVSLDGRTFALINENAGDWIIEDAEENKVAQFSSRNSGVRKAIVEFSDGAMEELGQENVAALSWFARLVLESKLGGSSTAIIATLVFLSAVAVLAVLF